MTECRNIKNQNYNLQNKRRLPEGLIVKSDGVLVKYEGETGKILWKKKISATMTAKTETE